MHLEPRIRRSKNLPQEFGVRGARPRIPLVGLLWVVLLALLCLPLSAQDVVPIPPAPTRWVTDTANFLRPDAVDQLDSRLRLYQEQTQHQLIIWIGKTTGDVPIEDWANNAFEKWKVGRKGIDDGLVLFVMADDHKLRFEVGYGLEPDVPDLLAKRILDNIVTPGFRAGDPAVALNQAMETVATAIGQPLPGSSPTATAQRQGREPRPVGLGQLIFYGIIALILLGVLATNPSLATWLLISFLSGGGGRRGRGGGGFGGGGWGGGGGFSGGGGMSGGGGASGSW